MSKIENNYANDKSTEDEGKIRPMRFDFCNENTEKFIESAHASFVQNPLEYHSNFSDFTYQFNNILYSTCLSSSTPKSKRNIINNQWITPAIINSVKTKTKLYKMWKKSITSTNKSGDDTLYTDYKNYRRKLKSLIKLAKGTLHHRKFDKAKGDMKKTWQLINDLRGKHKEKPKPSFIINSELIKNRRIIATEFNTYFTSIASKLNNDAIQSGIPISEIPDFSSYLPGRNPNSFHLEDCSHLEIEKIINEFSNDTASDIPITLVKKCSKIISPLLAYHFNKFMQTGIFPDQLKIGSVTPVYKSGEKELLKNYRPISTLPLFGKIFEKVIYSRMYNFLQSQNILYNGQFGYRKHYSSSHALNYSVEEILEANESKLHTIGIFIDLSKAFDTIDHTKLLSKLECYGIRSNAHSLISSYLSNRQQYIKFLNMKNQM